jgi:hypothetical protein
MHDIMVEIAKELGKCACKRAAELFAPYGRVLWRALFPLELGTLVALGERHFSIIETRGTRLNRGYKLASIKGVHPFLWPFLHMNHTLVKDGTVMWYSGGNLKKLSRPTLKIKLSLTQRVIGLHS